MTSDTLTCVIADLKAREVKGIDTYGTTVDRTDLSARDWAQHGYEEALDLTVYLRRQISAVDDLVAYCDALAKRNASLLSSLRRAEAALADIGDADREPGDNLAWCERRAKDALPEIRQLLGYKDKP